MQSWMKTNQTFSILVLFQFETEAVGSNLSFSSWGFPPVIEGSFQPQDMAEDTNQDLVKGGWGTIACNSSNPLDI